MFNTLKKIFEVQRKYLTEKLLKKKKIRKPYSFNNNL